MGPLPAWSAMSTPNPYAPPRAEVSDEPFPLTTEHAAPGRRLGAVVLDVLFLFCAILPSVIAVGLERATVHNGQMAASIGGVISLAGLVLWLLWTLVLLHQGGQTLGKRILRIRIVRTSGARASLPRLILLRFLVSIVLVALPSYAGKLCFLLDSAMLLGKSRQCLHDRTADTIVVKV